MNSVFTFILGLLSGWLIAWLIDFVYWRRRDTADNAPYPDSGTHITPTSSADSFDLFKTLVTATLATTVVLMLVSEIAFAPAQTSSAGDTTVILLTTPRSAEPGPVTVPTEVVNLSSALPTPTATTTLATIVATSTVASVTGEKSITVPGQPTATGTQEITCSTSVPSRLRVGQTARVVQRVRMRYDASIGARLIQTNLPNTQVEIIGGPVCTPMGDHAYLWWQIRLKDGTEGWSAESQLNEASYFLQPVP